MVDIDPKTASNTPPAEPVHDPAHAGHIDPALPRLRTFADDLSEEIKKKGTTTATIVQAERERAARELALDQEPEVSRPSVRKNPLILTATLILVGAGIAALIGGYVYQSLDMSAKPTTARSIIFPNKVVVRDQQQYQTVPELLALERSEIGLSLGEVARIDLTLANASTTAREILRALGAPETLVREARTVMVGIHSFNRTQPFLIIEITQYDRAYGAMLAWEEDMARALGNFFKPEGGQTPPTLTFTDKVFQNIDTRISQNEWPVIWGFPRRDVLVITTNQFTLSETLTRLYAQSAGVQE